MSLISVPTAIVGEWSVTINAKGNALLHCDARVPPSLTPKRT